MATARHNLLTDLLIQWATGEYTEYHTAPAALRSIEMREPEILSEALLYTTSGFIQKNEPIVDQWELVRAATDAREHCENRNQILCNKLRGNRDY